MSERLQSVVTDVNCALLDAADTLRTLVGQRVTISLSMAPRLGAVRVDPNVMRRVIIGLARNADEAMPTGGLLFIETQNTHFEAEKDCDGIDLSPGDYVCLSVSHTCTTPEPIGSVASDCGMELRLALIHEFAKRNGGAVTVHSELDAGATVSLFLPQAVKDTFSISLKEQLRMV